MRSRTRSPTSNHWDLYRLRHPPRQFAVKSPPHPIHIHTRQQYLPSPPSLRLHGPLDHPQSRRYPSARDKDFRISNRINRSARPSSVNCHDYRLRTEAGPDLPDQFRPRNCTRIDAHLVGSCVKNSRSVLCRANPASNRERHKQLLRSPLNRLQQRPATLMRSCNVQQNNLVSSAASMPMREFCRIASVHNVHKLHAFDDASTAHVEAGDDPFGKQPKTSHSCSSPDTAPPKRRSHQPDQTQSLPFQRSSSCGDEQFRSTRCARYASPSGSHAPNPLRQRA
jgi:hypothetical protein